MIANEESDVALPSWLGVMSAIPLVLLMVAIAVHDIPFFYSLGVVVILSIGLSVVFSVLASRRRFRFMIAWWFAFVIFIPFANIAFWLLHRKK